MTGSDAVIAERYRRNRAFLVARHPGLALPPAGAALASMAEVDGAGHLVNVRLGPNRLYPDSAEETAGRQIEAARTTEGRYRPPMIRATEEDRLVFDAMSNIERRMGTRAITQPAPYAFEDRHGPLAIVFGAGLGIHLLKLADSFDVRHLIVYEPAPVFLDLASYVVDWNELANRFGGDTGSFHLLTDADGVAAGRAIIDILASRITPAALTGAVMLKHYHCDPFDQVVAQLRTYLPLVTQIPGYFKDQARQVDQMIGSLRTADRYLKSRAQPHPGRGLVVVGAGPSLDRALPLLKELEGRATIFSCGSSLRPLTRAGIVPDLHVELETDPTTGSVLDSIGRPDLLKSIPLVTSAGSAAETNSRFASTFIFRRQGSVAGGILGEEILTLPFADPLVGNAAVSLGVSLGFRRIAMLGVDFGFRDKRRHHAEGTVYVDDATRQTRTDYRHIGLDQAITGFESDIAYFPIPSVAGDAMLANETFLLSLRSMEMLIGASPGLTLFQVGDGAQVAGAVNLALGKFDSLSFGVQGALRGEDLLAPFAPLEAELRDLTPRLRAFLDAAEKYGRELAVLLDPVPRTLIGLIDRAQAATNLLNAMRRQGHEACATLFGGPVRGFFQILVGRCAGIPASAEVVRLLEAASAELPPMIKHMLDSVRSLERR